MDFIKQILNEGITELDVYGVGYPTHKIVEIEKSGNYRKLELMQQMEHVAGMQVEVDPVDVVKLQKEFAKAVGVKRNKQVDVPTEAWQKNVERDMAELDDYSAKLANLTFALVDKLHSNGVLTSIDKLSLQATFTEKE